MVGATILRACAHFMYHTLLFTYYFNSGLTQHRGGQYIRNSGSPPDAHCQNISASSTDDATGAREEQMVSRVRQGRDCTGKVDKSADGTPMRSSSTVYMFHLDSIVLNLTNAIRAGQAPLIRYQICKCPLKTLKPQSNSVFATVRFAH
eukprot:SAG31_NODE_92_length_26360_cov_29.601881_1_plen_148_part_00